MRWTWRLQGKRLPKKNTETIQESRCRPLHRHQGGAYHLPPHMLAGARYGLAGVNVGRTTIGVYLLSGRCSALVSIMPAGFSGEARQGQ
jgi:hypothetical protein